MQGPCKGSPVLDARSSLGQEDLVDLPLILILEPARPETSGITHPFAQSLFGSMDVVFQHVRVDTLPGVPSSCPCSMQQKFVECTSGGLEAGQGSLSPNGTKVSVCPFEELGWGLDAAEDIMGFQWGIGFDWLLPQPFEEGGDAEFVHPPGAGRLFAT